MTNEFKSIPGIVDITFADADFVAVKQNWRVNLSYDAEEKMIEFVKIGVSPNFFDFFGLKFTSGENFIKTESNFDEVIFNQTAIREFGIDDFEKARMMGESRIVGVIEDFNLKSAHYPVSPVGFMNSGEVTSYIYLKTNTQNYTQLKNLMSSIEQKWNELSPISC